MATHPKERIGTTVGNFKILDYRREQRKNYQETHFFIHCLLCSNEKWIASSTVLKPTTKGCGCQKKRSYLRGQTFGRLTAIAPTEKRDTNDSVIWDCKCSCGKSSQAAATSLISGTKRSCGCLQPEAIIEAVKKRDERLVVENTMLTSLTAKTRSNSKSGVKGVYWYKRTQKWRAHIGFQGKRIELGSFKNIEDAIQARKEGEEKYFKPILEKYKDRLKPQEIKKMFPLTNVD